MTDSLIEKSVGGVLLSRRCVSGSSLGREGTAREARQMVFNFRLDPSVTQHLSVSYQGFHFRARFHFRWLKIY